MPQMGCIPMENRLLTLNEYASPQYAARISAAMMWTSSIIKQK